MFNEDFNFDVDPFDPIPFGSNNIQRRTLVAYDWGDLGEDLVGPAISYIGDVLAGDDDDNVSETSSTSTAIVQPKTESGQTLSDLDFSFDAEFTERFKAFTDFLSEWSQDDRQAFERYAEYQGSLMDTNQAIAGLITENSTASLQSNLNDLVGSDMLKKMFRENMAEFSDQTNKFAQQFAEQVGQIPTPEQRVGEMVSGIEQKFGQAGAELKRQMAAKGMDVSQASLRELAISKATALAGGSAQAKEAARLEKANATQAATGVFSDLAVTQGGLLTEQQKLTQSGADLTPQLDVTEQTSDASKLAASGLEAGATTVQGTETETKAVEHVQPGIKGPIFYDSLGNQVTETGDPIETGQDGTVNGSGNTTNAGVDDGPLQGSGTEDPIVDPVTGVVTDDLSGAPGDTGPEGANGDQGTGESVADTNPDLANSIETGLITGIEQAVKATPFAPLSPFINEVLDQAPVGQNTGAPGSTPGGGTPAPGSSGAAGAVTGTGVIGIDSANSTGLQGAGHEGVSVSGSGLTGRELAEFNELARTIGGDGDSTGGNVGVGSSAGNPGDPPGTAGGGLRCFIAGTQISTPDGFINIEDIVDGQEVMSWDLYSNKVVTSLVGKLTTTQRLEYYMVTFESGNSIGITNDHPLYTDNGWESIDPTATCHIDEYNHVDLVSKLNADSWVWTQSDNTDLVKSIIPVLGQVTMYTLCCVSPAENFFANGYLASDINGDKI